MAPPIWMLTSPSPSIWLAWSASRPERAPGRRAARVRRPGSQRSMSRRKVASRSRESRSAPASARSGTIGIRNVFISRGIARYCSSSSSAGCEPGPTMRTGNRKVRHDLLLRHRDRTPPRRDGDAGVGARTAGAAQKPRDLGDVFVPVAQAVDRADVLAVPEHHERRPAPEPVARLEGAGRLGQQHADLEAPGERGRDLRNDHREIERLLEAHRILDEKQQRVAGATGERVEVLACTSV